MNKIILIGIILFSLFSCVIEEVDNSDLPENEKNITARNVSINEIPEIYNFINDVTKNSGVIELKTRPGQREANLTVGEIDTTNIKSTTNVYNLTNYTFGLKKSNPDGESTFLNLVVKETNYGIYGFVVFYRPANDWWSHRHWGEFEGDILYYRLDGTYVASQTYINGRSVYSEVVDPCVNSESGGGNNSNNSGGADSNNSSGDTGDSGDSGDSGSADHGDEYAECEIVITHSCGNNCQPGQTENCEGGIDIYEIDCGHILVQRGVQDILRSPGDCQQCYDEWDNPCSCIPGTTDCITDQEEEENNDIAIAYDLMLFLELSQYVVLTQDHIDWINDPEHPENHAFAQYALEVLQEGGVVDFDDKVILDESFVNNDYLMCVYELLRDSNSDLFAETVGQFHNTEDYRLIFEVGNCVNTDVACTVDEEMRETGNVIIRFEDVTSSILETAGILLHEAIHAELALFVDRFESGHDLVDRPYLFQLYKYYMEEYSGGDIDHIYMTLRYIEPLAQALRLLDDNSYPLDYYKAYAWEGLHNWDAAGILNDEDESLYYEYQSIVEANTNLSCD